MKTFTLRDIGKLPFNATLGGYQIRFRVVSHDRNRVSAWTPYYTILVPESMSPSAEDVNFLNVASFTVTAAMPGDRTVVTAVWEKIEGVDEVDVFEQKDGGSWTWKGRQPSWQASNIVQFVYDLLVTSSVRLSFHRPTDDSTYSYLTRLFQTDTLNF